MTKILLIIALFAAVSCSYHNQNIDFNLHLDQTKSDIGHSSDVRVFIFDQRSDRDVIGEKIFGQKVITIAANQKLNILLRKEIRNNLALKGFKNGRNASLKLYIKNLAYRSERGFPIGKSEASSTIKVVAHNVVTKKTLTKNFNLNLNDNHFIASFKATDAEIINSLLEEIIQNIMDDESILEALVH